MADRKISELTQITGANVDDANDEIAIVDASASETKAITRAELMSSVSAMSIDGDLTVDTDTLYVDSANNRVGIGTSSPSSALDVQGDVGVSGGIYLGGTGAANLLDDYEEGTWTPTIVGTGVSYLSSITQGFYSKIGNLVVAQFTIILTDKGSSTGQVRIGGLPFASASSTGFPISPVNCFNLASVITTVIQIGDSDTDAPIKKAGTDDSLLFSEITDNTQFRGTLSYRTDA